MASPRVATPCSGERMTGKSSPDPFRKPNVEAQINAKDALLQVQAAEIARLRRIVCDTSP